MKITVKECCCEHRLCDMQPASFACVVDPRDATEFKVGDLVWREGVNDFVHCLATGEYAVGHQSAWEKVRVKSLGPGAQFTVTV